MTKIAIDFSDAGALIEAIERLCNERGYSAKVRAVNKYETLGHTSISMDVWEEELEV